VIRGNAAGPFSRPRHIQAIDYGRAEKKPTLRREGFGRVGKRVTVKPGPSDTKVAMLITGDELRELKRLTVDMAEAFGLGRRIEAYSGKRPLGFYRWDLDCLLAVTENAIQDNDEYSDKTSSAYTALRRLHVQLRDEYSKAYG
jgi:hypothetical protein